MDTPIKFIQIISLQVLHLVLAVDRHYDMETTQIREKGEEGGEVFLLKKLTLNHIGSSTWCKNTANVFQCH